jgi:hypothetical protein
MRKPLSFLIACFAFISAAAECLAAETEVTHVEVYKNPDTGLLTWSAEADGFSVELIQLLPDFIRAIYSKHELPAKQIDDIASYCVFGSIIKNTSDQTLTYNVADWRYAQGDQPPLPVKTKSQWIEQWRKAGVTFSWTLLPDAGTFYVGDWQQGFTTIKLPRDSEFDLIFTWQLEGTQHVGKITNLRCPPATLAR